MLNSPVPLPPYKVIASSNHLGNNDMLNLTTKKTLNAKMRVKSNIFAPWKEDINHEVRSQNALPLNPKVSVPLPYTTVSCVRHVSTGQRPKAPFPSVCAKSRIHRAGTMIRTGARLVCPMLGFWVRLFCVRYYCTAPIFRHSPPFSYIIHVSPSSHHKACILRPLTSGVRYFF